MKRSRSQKFVGRLVKADSPNLCPFDKFLKRGQKTEERSNDTSSQELDNELELSTSRSSYNVQKLESTSCDSNNKREPETFINKYEKAAPYFLFLASTVPNSGDGNFSITFPEILDLSFGTILETLHINEYVNIDWLSKQYALAGQKLNGLVIYKMREDAGPIPDTIKRSHKSQQHSKLMILRYDNGVRVVIFTGNLREDDWDKRTQSVWISPHLKYLDQDHESSNGDSDTKFRKNLISYLSNFSVPKWCEYLAKLDCSSLKVFFIGSVPGLHSENSKQWGIKKLSNLLTCYDCSAIDDNNSSLVIQCTSLGSFDSSSNDWLKNEFFPPLRSAVPNQADKLSPSNFKIVFPTMENYEESLDTGKKSVPLHYSSRLHSSQQWIVSHLCRWTTKSMVGRMPHSKCYIKISSDDSAVFWVVITSANLSMAAWGRNVKRELRTYSEIKNYEAGVAFFPKVMVI